MNTIHDMYITAHHRSTPDDASPIANVFIHVTHNEQDQWQFSTWSISDKPRIADSYWYKSPYYDYPTFISSMLNQLSIFHLIHYRTSINIPPEDWQERHK